MPAMTRPSASHPHNQVQRMSIVRTLKSLDAPAFADGDLVELPSGEIARYQSEARPPQVADLGWHLHPQTEDGTGDAVEHDADGKGWIKPCLWSNADRSVKSAGDMVPFNADHRSIWRGGLVIPARCRTVPCLLTIRESGSHSDCYVELCSDCYATGPDGEGYDADAGAIITVNDRGYCEVCMGEFVVECDRLVEIPEGTVEKDRLTADNRALVVVAIAAAFRHLIQKQIASKHPDVSDEARTRIVTGVLSTIDSRNAELAKTRPGACATHDYCDANMVMDAAFHAVLRREPSVESDGDMDLWNSAWNLAKADGFSVRSDDPPTAAATPPPAVDDKLARFALALFDTARKQLGETAILVEAADAMGLDISDTRELLAAVQATRPVEPEEEPAVDPSAPKCPKCGCTDLDRFTVKESYTAYHPIEAFDRKHGKGWLQVANALATTCPSEHFDEGDGDYGIQCGECCHVDTPETFGFDDDVEWEWV